MIARRRSLAFSALAYPDWTDTQRKLMLTGTEMHPAEMWSKGRERRTIAENSICIRTYMYICIWIKVLLLYFLTDVCVFPMLCHGSCYEDLDSYEWEHECFHIISSLTINFNHMNHSTALQPPPPLHCLTHFPSQSPRQCVVISWETSSKRGSSSCMPRKRNTDNLVARCLNTSYTTTGLLHDREDTTTAC